MLIFVRTKKRWLFNWQSWYNLHIASKRQITPTEKTPSALADPGGRTRRAPPPNGRGPMDFYAQNAIFLIFFGARFARDSF